MNIKNGRKIKKAMEKVKNYIQLHLNILLFSLTTLFQLITLPVEFNASHRALQTLENEQLLYDDELPGARKVLKAAALTYVAALLMSVLQLLRYVLIFVGRNNRGRRDN